MLAVVYNHYEEIVWHVNEGKIHYINNIEYIQADGHELDHIRKMFDPQIPMPRGPVVKFYGDLAKTIAANIANISYEH